MATRCCGWWRGPERNMSAPREGKDCSFSFLARDCRGVVNAVEARSSLLALRRRRLQVRPRAHTFPRPRANWCDALARQLATPAPKARPPTPKGDSSWAYRPLASPERTRQRSPERAVGPLTQDPPAPAFPGTSVRDWASLRPQPLAAYRNPALAGSTA